MGSPTDFTFQSNLRVPKSGFGKRKEKVNLKNTILSHTILGVCAVYK